MFQNRKGFPVLVSGVPPDAFSETGQLWDRFVRMDFYNKIIIVMVINVFNLLIYVK